MRLLPKKMMVLRVSLSGAGFAGVALVAAGVSAFGGVVLELLLL